MAATTPSTIPSIAAGPWGAHPHTHTVVFLHGRGDSARAFAGALARWRGSCGRNPFQLFPSLRWVFPQAPVRALARAADTAAAWPQWFDVWDPADFAANEALQAHGLREAVPALRRLLDAEAARLGGRRDKVVLAGISMGGATAAHVLFHLDLDLDGAGDGAGLPLAAFLGFACRCPFVGRDLAGMRAVLGLQQQGDNNDDGEGRGKGISGGILDRALRGTPMLLEHCVDDATVPVAAGRQLTETLRAFGADVERREYPAGGHWFNAPTGLDDVREFLERRLGVVAAGADVRRREQVLGPTDPMDLS
ncbi:alpha/beta-hydrolase [Hypoxylon sp. FL1284]|nr:alpha/beta-hydrolase [Hypoxylon sp. FL1284]